MNGDRIAMALETSRWDVTEFLDSEERIALYREEAFSDGEPALIVAAVGDVAQARWMSQLSKETGIARPALYRLLSGDGMA
jgi:probable addiction module antidote protein